MLKRYRLLIELKKTLAMLVGILSLGVASAYAEPIDNGTYTSRTGLTLLKREASLTTESLLPHKTQATVYTAGV